MKIGSNSAQLALALLLAVQVFFIARIGVQAAKPSTSPAITFVEVGDTVLSLKNSAAMSSDLRADDGRPILLLSLKSTCQWCTEEMPRIRKDLAGLPANIRLAVITSESDSIAISYLKENGINAPVIAVGPEDRASLERRITSRTPWAFLLDSQGIVKASSHSSDLSRIIAANGRSRNGS